MFIIVSSKFRVQFTDIVDCERALDKPFPSATLFSKRGIFFFIPFSSKNLLATSMQNRSVIICVHISLLFPKKERKRKSNVEKNGKKFFRRDVYDVGGV